MADCPSFNVYLDESIVDRHRPGGKGSAGKRIMVGAVVTPSEHLERAVDAKAQDVLADAPRWAHRQDEDSNRDRQQLFAKEGFHFGQDSPGIRDEGLGAMFECDFRVHVCYSHGALKQLSEADLQIAMYSTLVRTLLLRYAGAHLRFMFEESSVMDDIYARIVQQAVDSLDRSTRLKKRQPRASAEACLGSKPHGGLSTVDYCLGVVDLGLQRHYGDGKRGVWEAELAWVDRLDGHLAHLMDFDMAVHRQRFDMLEQPHWARHIAGTNSSSEVSSAFSTLINRGSVGPFSYIRTPSHLAKTLGVTLHALNQGMQASVNPGSYRFPVVRIKGKSRTFTVPTDPLLIMLHRRLHDFLRPLSAFLHPSCVGYVPGRSAADAARPHSGRQWVQRLDIADFYPNTTPGQVSAALQRLGAHESVADAISLLATHNDQLPTGVRTSPVLSNIVLADFDYVVAAAAEERGVVYTRYADDLIFSADEEFDATDWVAEALSPLGYALNPRKTRRRRRGQPMKIVGLTVFEPDGPRVPRPMKRRLRLELYNLSRAIELGIDDDVDPEDEESQAELWEFRRRVARLRGLVRYCMGVEPVPVQRLLDKFPVARTYIQPATETPEARGMRVGNLVRVIRETRTQRLTPAFVRIGPDPREDGGPGEQHPTLRGERGSTA